MDVLYLKRLAQIAALAFLLATQLRAEQPKSLASTSSLIRTARKLYKEGFKEQAAKILEVVQQREPNNDAAVRLLEKINKQKGANPGGPANRKKQNNNDEAKEAQKKIAAARARAEREAEIQKKRRLREIFERAKEYAKEGKFEEAVRLGESILDEMPNNGAVASKVYQWRKEIERQKAEAEKKARTVRANILLGIAREYLNANRFEKAREAIKQALEASPKNPEAKQLLKQVGAAEQEYKRAVRARQQEKAVADAQVLRAKGQYMAAMKTVEDAFKGQQLSGEAKALIAQLQKEVTLREKLKAIQQQVAVASKTAQGGGLAKALAGYKAALRLARKHRLSRQFPELPDRIKTLEQELAKQKEEKKRKARELARKEAATLAAVRKATRAGRLEEAEALINKAKQDPDLASSKSIQKAAQKVKEKKLAAEKRARRKAMESAISKARRLVAEGDFDRAEKILQNLQIKEFPDLQARTERLLKNLPLKRAERQKKTALADIARARRMISDVSRLDEARALVEQAKKACPEVEARADAVLATIAKAKAAQAKKAAEEAKRREQEALKAKVAALSESAREHLAQGKLDAAQKDVDEILKLAPESATAKRLRARVDSARKAGAAAEARRKAALAVEQARRLLENREYDKALAVLRGLPRTREIGDLAKDIARQKALAAQRDEMAKLTAEADAKAAKGDLEDALDAYEKASALARKAGLRKDARAISAKIAGVKKQIRAAAEQHKKARKDAERTLNERVQALLKAEKFDEAEKALAAARKSPLLKDSNLVAALASRAAQEKKEAQARAEAKAREAKALAAYESARGLLEEGKFDDAEAALRRVGEGIPRPLARRIRDMLEKEIPRAKENREAYLKALATKKAEAAYKEAMALLDKGDLDGSEAALKRIDTSISDSMAARVKKALAETLPRAREKQARNAVADVKRLAAANAKEGRYEEALKLLAEARRKYPAFEGELDSVIARVEKDKADAEAARIRAEEERKRRLEEERRKKEEAELLARKRKEEEAARKRAEEERRLKEEKERLARLQREAAQENFRRRLKWARALYREGKPESALKLLEELKDSEFATAGVKAFYNDVSIDVKKRAEVLAEYEKKVAKNPSDPDSQLILGYLYLDRGMVQKGVKAYETLVNLLPNEGAVYINLGYAYRRLGNFSKAEQAYKKALELLPEKSQAYNHLAYLYLSARRNLAEALTLAGKAYKLSPADPDIRHTLAYAYLLNNDYEKAHRILARLVKKSKNDEVFYHYGVVLQKLGRAREAQKVFTALCERSPDFREKAAEALKSLP